MNCFICSTCGTQYAATEVPPEKCAICTDERQYVPPSGQSWTTLSELQKTHKATFHPEGELIGIGTDKQIGIGQRALLLRTPHGNILWDGISLVNPLIHELINGIGGLTAIAISHPHFYTSMVEWSHAFGDIPVYIHDADRDWVMRSDPILRFWNRDICQIAPGVTLIRCGGHFEGSTVLHWADGAEGRGALLSGDTLQVAPDRAHLAFMRSYPNYIPLGATTVQSISDRLLPWKFEAIYGAFWSATILTDGKSAFQRSVSRHLKWLNSDVTLN